MRNDSSRATYHLNPDEFEPEDVPELHNYAILVGRRLVQRCRDGRMFDLTYLTRQHAVQGLKAAHGAFPDAYLWSRYDPGNRFVITGNK